MIKRVKLETIYKMAKEDNEKISLTVSPWIYSHSFSQHSIQECVPDILAGTVFLRPV